MKPLEHCKRMVEYNFPDCVVEAADIRVGGYFIAKYKNGCRHTLTDCYSSRELEAYLEGVLQSKMFKDSIKSIG